MENYIQNDPSKHHTIPKCCLEKFVDRKGDIFKAKLTDKFDTLRAMKPSAVGYQTDFYRIDNEWIRRFLGGVDPLILEKDINQKKYENKFNSLFKNLFREAICITRNEAFEIAEFLIHLKIRSPYYRRTMYTKDNVEEALNGVVKSVQENPEELLGERPISLHSPSPFSDLFGMMRAMVSEFVSNDKFLADFHKVSLIKREVERENKLPQEVFWNFVRGKWTVYHAPVGAYFITTDNPGATILPNKRLENMAFGGVFTYCYPLSKKELLVVFHDKYDIVQDAFVKINHKNCSADFVLEANLLMAVLADREIYGPDNRGLNHIKRKLKRFEDEIPEKRVLESNSRDLGLVR